MAPRFVLYVIHTEAHRLREGGLHASIQHIRLAAQSAGYVFKSVFILRPDPPTLQERLKEYEKAIDYTPVGDVEFDQPNNLHILSLQELSNLEKHREAWRRIAADADAAAVHAVIENDVVLLPDFDVGMATFQAQGPWDFMPWGSLQRILPSKEAYFIRPAMAASLLSAAPIKFGARLLLSWAIQSNPQWRVGECSPRWTVDGSKLGLFPSTTRANNALIYNREYMDVYAMMQKTSWDAGDVGTVTNALLPALAKLAAPDAMHLVGVAHHRMGNAKRARDCFLEAIEAMGKQQGLVTTTSELMKNTLNIFRFLQVDELKRARQQPSKYASAPLR